jgi:hypothetical protein
MATHISFNRLNINDLHQLDGYLHGYISQHWNALRPRVYWLQRTFTAILRGEDQSGFIPRPATGFQAKADDMPASKIAEEMRPPKTKRVKVTKAPLRPSICDLAAAGGAYVI